MMNFTFYQRNRKTGMPEVVATVRVELPRIDWDAGSESTREWLYSEQFSLIGDFDPSDPDHWEKLPILVFGSYFWVVRNDIVERGGAGSGHHDHAGRPGKVGGSAPSKVQGEYKVGDAVSLFDENSKKQDGVVVEISDDGHVGIRFSRDPASVAWISKDDTYLSHSIFPSFVDLYEDGDPVIVFRSDRLKDETLDRLRDDGIRPKLYSYCGRSPAVYFFSNEEDAEHAARWMLRKNRVDLLPANYIVVEFEIPPDMAGRVIVDSPMNYSFDGTDVNYKTAYSLHTFHIPSEYIRRIHTYTPDGEKVNTEIINRSAPSTGFMVIFFDPAG